MTKRQPAAAAPGPLEGYAQQFDDQFERRTAREAFRRYLEGLLLPAAQQDTAGAGECGADRRRAAAAGAGAAMVPVRIHLGRRCAARASGGGAAGRPGDGTDAVTRPSVSWPVRLRRVRAWLEPWVMLRR